MKKGMYLMILTNKYSFLNVKMVATLFSTETQQPELEIAQTSDLQEIFQGP